MTELIKLRLNEFLYINSDVRILRVPDGLLYIIGSRDNPTVTFVPFK